LFLFLRLGSGLWPDAVEIAKMSTTEPSNASTSSSTASGTTGQGRWSNFLKPVNEYKELIALLLFFLGGAFWIFDYFATKHQVKQLQCLLNANIGFIQGRMDSGSLSQILVENLRESASLDMKQTLTAEETLKRNQLRTAASDIGRKIADADGATAQALSKLKSGDCVMDH
jgi:hypothetical protein